MLRLAKKLLVDYKTGKANRGVMISKGLSLKSLDSDETFHVNIPRFEKVIVDEENFLGGGSYGRVFKLNEEFRGKQVAIKHIDLPQNKNERKDTLSICQEEATIMEKINKFDNHYKKYIITYFGSFTIDDTFAFVMEQAE